MTSDTQGALDRGRLKAGGIRFIKFGIVGGSGVLVNTGLLHALTEWVGWDYRISSLVAIQTAILNNFLWNSLWTWRDRRTTSAGRAALRLAKFNGSSALVALVVNWGLLVLLTETAGLYYQVSNLIGIAFGTIANFLISHLWTFRKPGTENACVRQE